MRKIGALFGVLAVSVLAGGPSTLGGETPRTAAGGYQLDLGSALAAADGTGAAAGATSVLPASSSGRETRRRTAAAGGETTWLAMGEVLAQAAEADKAPATKPAPQTQPAGAAPGHREFVPFKERRGPAYPGDMLTSLGRTGKEFPGMLWDDTRAVVTNPVSLVGLGLAGAAGIAIAGSGADNEVADQTSRHGHRLNTFWDSVGDACGNPGTHFAVAGVMYFGSQVVNDTKCYETSVTMLSALSINGIVTMGLKGIVHTRSPNGDRLGWPSGHASSSFCFAAVMNEAYGPWVGIPLYAFAGFISYERIDARNHDFSDVVSGALIGYAIGYAVSRNHQWKVLGMDVVPFMDPEKGSVGLALAKQW